jgi:hypothetical protein
MARTAPDPHRKTDFGKGRMPAHPALFLWPFRGLWPVNLTNLQVLIAKNELHW